MDLCTCRQNAHVYDACMILGYDRIIAIYVYLPSGWIDAKAGLEDLKGDCDSLAGLPNIGSTWENLPICNVHDIFIRNKLRHTAAYLNLSDVYV